MVKKANVYFICFLKENNLTFKIQYLFLTDGMIAFGTVNEKSHINLVGIITMNLHKHFVYFTDSYTRLKDYFYAY